MSATVAASILPIVDRRALTTSESNLVSLLRTKASWIWTTEESMPAPTAPVNIQRAFRKTFPVPSGSTPSNLTILVAADDYFAMYVNGVLVQTADISHDYHNILAFNVPLPVVKGDSTSSVVLAFRVINRTDTLRSEQSQADSSLPTAGPPALQMSGIHLPSGPLHARVRNIYLAFAAQGPNSVYFSLRPAAGLL